MKEKLVTVARFQYSSEAQIIKGRLVAENIETFLADEYIIDTDPLISNAIGGVKLQVWKEDKILAEEVLANISSFSVDDNGEALICPNCQSHKIRYYTTINDFRSFFSFLLCLFFVVLPISVSYKYHCENCHKKFNLK
ncbi:DUF2007 domain-containing protein [Mesonia maritima]|uniref:DUF2007 domain-containing protein n=1 Tax=Mesonia maritima TaxID=1793873 RepID=A0ABU1K1T1_9FLAO|nr:DUF2007 domain-containing protein [Mesonia maritima]MDR6299565.1 hypothetical protein [Mesonia maritima]